METTTRPVEPDAVLAALAAYWSSPAPARFTNRVPGKIAGSPHDQLVPAGAENPYWEIVRQIPLDTIGSPWRSRPEPDAYFFDLRDPAPLLLKDAQPTVRHALCATFSWSIPSPGDIAWITSRLGGKGIVEPGAGGGYWAWQLTQAGADVIAYDPHEAGSDGNSFAAREWHPVLRGDHDAVKAHPDRAMLLCWPSYAQPWASWALSSYRGDQIFYAGEGEGGCCADDAFFELLGAEWEEVGDCPAHVSFGGIHCYLTEYRRRESRCGGSPATPAQEG